MKLDNNITYSLSLCYDRTISGQKELLFIVLDSLGKPIHQWVESETAEDTKITLFSEDEKELTILASSLQDMNLKGIRVEKNSVRNSEWMNRWKEDFKPFHITEDIEIVPAWMRKTYNSKKTPLYIDTILAFGTGLHATTQLMTQFIKLYRGKYKTVLDIGTGTGILTFIAEYYGAEQILGIDLTQDIIKIARENARLNRVTKVKYRAVNFSNWSSAKTYDFVAANLVTDVLIEFADQLVAKVSPGGYLAISGISESNCDRLKECFKGYPIRCLRSEKLEGWVAFLFQRILGEKL